MNQDNTNLGIYAMNVPRSHEPRTVVVLGLPRSGTSMVAGTLYHLGVDMGDKFNTSTFEDSPLSGAIEHERLDNVRRIVEERNSRSEVWGWKRPSSFRYLSLIEREFRNPYYVSCFRDLLAIATRRELSIGRDVVETLQSSIGAQKKIIEFVAGTGQPVLLISYEKAIQRPWRVMESIASFVGLEPNTTAADFITPDPAVYLEATRKRE